LSGIKIVLHRLEKINKRDEKMAIQYADLLSASNIYNEVMKEINQNKSFEELSKRSFYNKILKNCNKLIMERFQDYRKQEIIRNYIEKILLPIYKNNFKGEEVPTFSA